MDNANVTNNEEEISLVDLLVVLIKRRYLILGTIAVALVLFLVWIFAYPAYLSALPATSAFSRKKVETSVSFIVNPAVKALQASAAANSGDKGLEGLASQILRDPRIVLSALLSAGIDELQKKDIRSLPAEEAMYFAKRLLIEGKTVSGATLGADSRMFAAQQDTASGAFTVVFRYKDPEKSRLFLSALMEQLNGSAKEVLRSAAETKVADYERGSRSAADASAAPVNSAAYTAGRLLLAGELMPLAMIGEPTVTISEPPLPSAKKVGVLVVFGSAFLAVFLAFVLEYIDHLKNDPESRAKIEAALARGKERAPRG
jgi:hypothetical protein